MTLIAPDHLRGSMGGASRDLIDARAAWVASAARAGHGVGAIAAALGISYRGAALVLKHAGIPSAAPGAPSRRAERVEMVAAYIAAHEPAKREAIAADLGLTANAVSDATQTLVAAGRAHSDGRGTYRAGPKPAPEVEPAPVAPPKMQLRGVSLPPAPFDITPPERDETLPRSAPIRDARMVSIRQDRFLRSVQGWR